MADMLVASEAELICLTEAYVETLPAGGQVIEGGRGNPVADQKGAKKVLLWCRGGWLLKNTAQDLVPFGRFASGIASTSIGPVLVAGVCIPWAASNTPRLGGDRRPWEDHLNFIRQLRPWFHQSSQRMILLGDFNQRLPASRQPSDVAAALESVLAAFVVATRGFRGGHGDLTIDHIAHTPDLRATEIAELPSTLDARYLSDHFGVVASIEPA